MDAAALYQKQILALAREARASKRLDEPMHTASARNPTCGDRVTVDLNTDDDGRISAMGAKVEGCALCEAATGACLIKDKSITLFQHHIFINRADAQLWPLQVGQNRNRLSGFLGYRPDGVIAFGVIFLDPMAEIEPESIGPGLHQLADHLRAAGGWPEGGENACC